jgi:hypothetical protein
MRERLSGFPRNVIGTVMSVEVGQELSLFIEKPAAGGRTIARHDGQVVLVAGAIPESRSARASSASTSGWRLPPSQRSSKRQRIAASRLPTRSAAGCFIPISATTGSLR